MASRANHPRGSKLVRAVQMCGPVNRALATLSAGNRTLLRASDEEELVHAMCRVIVETGGYRVAAVAYADHDAAKRLRWIANVGGMEDDFGAANFTWDDTEFGQTATGTAIRSGQPVIGRHILTDPAYAGPAYASLRENALRNGYASATAFPLRVNGEVLGALAMSAAEPDAFDAAEVKLLGELADDLAYGIANLRTGVQHRAAQATITRLAYYDTLTGLPNRTLLLEKLAAAIAASSAPGTLALLHLEVSRFSEINKVLGYSAGDELLRKLAARLQGAAQEALLARVGEAEFALLLPAAGAVAAVEVARHLVDLLNEPVEVADLMIDTRVGVGIALFPDHATDADTLVRRANAAVHQSGPAHSGFVMYTGGHEQGNTRRLSLMGDLHRAIEHGELQLYCQPKVDLATQRVCGAEALVRWEHPLKGMISPGEFIPLAEQAGTITPLTNWVLEAAFRQVHCWSRAGHTRPLAINLSALDLYDPGLVDRVRGLFGMTGIARGLIQFELTESALMVDPTDALETLTRLKQLGVELFVDDFGTGHSSLSYLQKLPVDAVKIDQSFVMPMESNEDSQVIVRSTIELGHNLGLKVVAEGVESEAIWHRLAALGCDVAQGYFIGRPLPTALFDRWEAGWTPAARRQ
jgi:diguanylate cyclase (GGDEF)-like protein